jgi:general secretion pathway protein G
MKRTNHRGHPVKLGSNGASRNKQSALRTRSANLDAIRHPLSAAFTLIELLVVISIIGILISLTLFGIQGARKSSRDAKRKADLETIRSALEIYRDDVGAYPTTLSFGSSLTYAPTNTTYMEEVPQEVLSDRNYAYSSSGTTYTLCVALEGGGSDSCSGLSCGTTCNYKVTNP